MPSETRPTAAGFPAAYPPPPPPAPWGAPPVPEVTLLSPVPEELAFHRLDRARAHRPRWWRPLAIAAVAAALYVAMIVVIMVPLVVVALMNPGLSPAFEMLERGEVPSFEVADPTGFLLLIVPLILMIPALLAASRMLGGRGVGLLLSVTGRIRWGWLGRSLLVALAVYAVQTAISLALAAVTGESIQADATQPGLWLMVLLIVLLVPLQSAAEEYVFRGFLMQAIGTWLKHPLFPILLPIPLFVFGHLYDVWGLLSVAVFAVAAAWLVWRTGGLESAIALHAVNNVSVFLLGAFRLADANATTGLPIDVVTTAITVVAYAGIIEWMQRRSSLVRTRTVLRPVPVPLPQG